MEFTIFVSFTLLMLYTKFSRLSGLREEAEIVQTVMHDR